MSCTEKKLCRADWCRCMYCISVPSYFHIKIEYVGRGWHCGGLACAHNAKQAQHRLKYRSNRKWSYVSRIACFCEIRGLGGLQPPVAVPVIYIQPKCHDCCVLSRHPRATPDCFLLSRAWRWMEPATMIRTWKMRLSRCCRPLPSPPNICTRCTRRPAFMDSHTRCATSFGARTGQPRLSSAP